MASADGYGVFSWGRSRLRLAAMLIALSLMAAAVGGVQPVAAQSEDAGASAWQGTIDVSGDWVDQDGEGDKTNFRWETAFSGSFEGLHLREGSDDGTTRIGRYAADTFAMQFDFRNEQPCDGGAFVVTATKELSGSSAGNPSEDETVWGFGSGNDVAFELIESTDGRVYYHPYYVHFAAVQTYTNTCGLPPLDDGLQAYDALAYTFGTSPNSDQPLLDNDPDPDRLVGTTTFTMSNPPYEGMVENWSWWDLVEYRYEITYDLTRTSSADGDLDGDGVPDAEDNCSEVPNSDQADGDGNGTGDACEDLDGDGVVDVTDNCLEVPNPDQADSDRDGTGDACEDIDGDLILDVNDNCPVTANIDQADADGDGLGDACEELIDQYAPLVRVHRGEDYFPVSTEYFLATSELRWEDGCDGDELITADPDRLGSPDLYVMQPTHQDGALAGCDPLSVDPVGNTDITRPHLPCEPSLCRDERLGPDEDQGFYVDHDDDYRDGGGKLDPDTPTYFEVTGNTITYWLFWPYSVPGGRYGGLGTGFQHEGDWERIVVRLNDDGEPHSVTYFFHHSKAEFGWDEIDTDQGHPVVYAAKLGHGSYWNAENCNISDPQAGSGPINDKTADACDADGLRWETWRNPINAKSQDWYGFGGAWGEAGRAHDTTGPLGPGPTNNPVPPPGTAGGFAFDGDPSTVERLKSLVGQTAGGHPLLSTLISRHRFVPFFTGFSSTAQRRFTQENIQGAAYADYAVLSRDDVFADSLVGAPLSADGPLLLTASDRLNTDVAAELQRVLAPGATVYLLGGEAALSATVAEDVAALGYQPQRLAGPSRVETSVEVAKEVALLNPDVALVGLARADDWADSVTGGAWAAWGGVPLMVTDSDELHPAVAAALEELAPSRTVLLGGTAALSDAVEVQVPAPLRVAGPTRAETATQVVDQLWGGPRLRYVVFNGYVPDGWAYGLPAAGLAADAGAPLLMANTDGLSSAPLALLTDCGVDVLLVGESEVLSPAVETAAAGC